MLTGCATVSVGCSYRYRNSKGFSGLRPRPGSRETDRFAQFHVSKSQLHIRFATKWKPTPVGLTTTPADLLGKGTASPDTAYDDGMSRRWILPQLESPGLTTDIRSLAMRQAVSTRSLSAPVPRSSFTSVVTSMRVTSAPGRTC